MCATPAGPTGPAAEGCGVLGAAEGYGVLGVEEACGVLGAAEVRGVVGAAESGVGCARAHGATAMRSAAAPGTDAALTAVKPFCSANGPRRRGKHRTPDRVRVGSEPDGVRGLVVVHVPHGPTSAVQLADGEELLGLRLEAHEAVG